MSAVVTPSTSTRLLPDGARAPELHVVYVCPTLTCMFSVVLDAYRGVPRCPHDHAVLVGERLA